MTKQTDSARPMCVEDIDYSGLTAQEHAAIALGVPKSGEEWLDKMIREANRMKLAGQLLAGNAANPACALNNDQMVLWSVVTADALLAELDMD